MKRIALFAAVIAMMAMSATSCSSSDNTANQNTEETAAEAQPVAETTAVIALSDDNLLRPDTKVTVPTILDFNATWCVPCKKLTPAFDMAAEAYADKAKFYSVDIDKNPQTAQAFNITGVPTVVFLLPDAEPQTYVGLDPFVTDNDLSPQAIYANISKMIDAAL